MDLMDKQLEKLPIGSRPFIMLGDYNINLHDLGSNIPTEFWQLCLSYSLFPTINICTCVAASSSKLLKDNIFTLI